MIWLFYAENDEIKRLLRRNYVPLMAACRPSIPFTTSHWPCTALDKQLTVIRCFPPFSNHLIFHDEWIFQSDCPSRQTWMSAPGSTPRPLPELTYVVGTPIHQIQEHNHPDSVQLTHRRHRHLCIHIVVDNRLPTNQSYKLIKCITQQTLIFVVIYLQKITK